MFHSCDGWTDSDRQTDGRAIAYTRYSNSIYAVAHKNPMNIPTSATSSLNVIYLGAKSDDFTHPFLV